MTTALNKEHVVLVAAGIGVTPIASILKTLLDHHAGVDLPPEDEVDAEIGDAQVAAASAPRSRPRRHSSAQRRVHASKLQRLDVFWCADGRANDAMKQRLTHPSYLLRPG